jgi:hypothetical protein
MLHVNQINIIKEFVEMQINCSLSGVMYVFVEEDEIVWMKASNNFNLDIF